MQANGLCFRRFPQSETYQGVFSTQLGAHRCEERRDKETRGLYIPLPSEVLCFTAPASGIGRGVNGIHHRPRDSELMQRESAGWTNIFNGNEIATSDFSHHFGRVLEQDINCF
jgi:hypothetical protein